MKIKIKRSLKLANIFRKKIIYLLICGIYFINISASRSQTTNTKPVQKADADLIGPSPNAMSLAKYGIIPVSLYTGIPEISIDLGIAEGRGISVPINLNYHNNGLKSYEKASWVGLGWSLNAGGVITRIIRDKIDELTPLAYQFDQNINKYNASQPISQDFLDGAMFGGLYDTEPDLYAYNFGKYSGSFFFFKNKVYQFPDNKLKITGTSSGPFTITTEDGVIYDFSVIETTQPKNSSTSHYSIPNHVSSWYLSTIQPPDRKEMITFGYSGYEPVLMHGATSQVYLKNNIGANHVLYDKEATLPSTVNTIRLQSISTSKMTVSFIPKSTLRTDIDGTGYALDAVIFKNVNGEPIKNFKLNYGYFGAGGQLASPLKLLSVIEDYGRSNKTHTFQYEGSDGTLPVLTDAVDHWGYSNGGFSSAIIFPNTIVPGGANREPNAQFASLGMLTKITYPTGGESRFVYEQNMYFSGKEYEKQGRSAGGFLQRLDINDNTLLTKGEVIEIGESQDVIVSFSRVPKEATSSDPNAPNGPNAFTKDIEPEVIITPVNGSLSPTYKFKIIYNYGNSNTEETVRLEPGLYQVTVQCDSKEKNVTGWVNYYDKKTIPIEGQKGPGLRIKSITAFSNPNQSLPALTKIYDYKDSLGFSTGVLQRAVSYGGSDDYTVEYRANMLVDKNTYLVYNSSISATLADLTNQEMYYRQVSEKQISQTDTLKSTSKFISYQDSYNYNRAGVMLSEKVDYKKNGNIYIPSFKEEYKYSYATDTLFSALKPYQNLQITIGPGGIGEERTRLYGAHWYSLSPGAWVYNISKTQTIYTEQSPVVTAIYYNNDVSKTRNLISIYQKNAKGYDKITKFKYPQSYASGIMQPFIEKHVLSPVIEEQEWVKRSATDSIIVKAKLIEYDNSIFKPIREYQLDIPAPVASLNQEVKTSEGLYTSFMSDSKYKDILTYSYDSSNGNLISKSQFQQQDKDVSYIWGYGNTLPIAECKNGAQNEFYFNGFEDGGTNVISGIAHTGKQYYSGDYSLNFVIPNNKAYRYSFWYLESGIWKYSGELNYTQPVVLSLGDAIDDIRIYPLEGQMRTFTYLPGIGMTSITDSRSQIVYYEYDTSQRLKSVKDQNGNILKNITYNYKF